MKEKNNGVNAEKIKLKRCPFCGAKGQIMTDEKFKDLKQHLRIAMTIIEKFESGEKDVKDESNWDFLIFNVGVSLIEIFRLTGEDPTGTLEWIRVVSKDEGI